eukprot:245953-Rhodomonas_salina.1
MDAAAMELYFKAHAQSLKDFVRREERREERGAWGGKRLREGCERGERREGRGAWGGKRLREGGGRREERGKRLR